MKELSISIVLYKTPLKQIERCINCLLPYNKIADLYLIDNSPKRDLEKVKNLFQGAKYVFLNSNQGYARGHNVSLRLASKSKCKYHLILNADCYFDHSIIKDLISIMDKNKKTGLIMPKILNPDGSIQMLCKLIPKPIDLLTSYLLKIIGINSFKAKHVMSESTHSKISLVPYLSGCFMFIRWETLKDIGFFDNRFFMYGEDIDLSRRIAEKYLTIYLPKYYVYHDHGKGSFKSFRIFLIHIKNIIIYFNKWGWIFDKKRKEINYKSKKFNSRDFIT